MLNYLFLEKLNSKRLTISKAAIDLLFQMPSSIEISKELHTCTKIATYGQHYTLWYWWHLNKYKIRFAGLFSFSWKDSLLSRIYYLPIWTPHLIQHKILRWLGAPFLLNKGLHSLGNDTAFISYLHWCMNNMNKCIGISNKPIT